MFRLVVILISIVWASLLLISWSGASPALEDIQESQIVIGDTL
jgi:hypothetical protein